MIIGDSVVIVVTREESNFDRACDSAYRQALSKFQIDEDGYSQIVQGWEKYTCCIEIEFKNYVRTGCNHHYTFVAKAVKEEGEEND